MRWAAASDMSRSQPHQTHQTHQTHTKTHTTKGSYATLGFAKTTTDWRNLAVVLAVVGGLLGANSAVKSVTAARTTQKRRRALESLEKDN